MTSKTFRLSGKSMDRSWRLIDAKGIPLGRIASEAAKLLLGKHKPNYEPFLPMGDFVVIINTDEIVVTGTKTRDKTYYRHSGYPGGLRARSFSEQMERDSTKVVEQAIKGMLPHNARGRELFRHLNVYSRGDHPHQAQLNEGTGERARKRVRQENNVVTESVDSTTVIKTDEEKIVVGDRLTGSLNRYKRAELDTEAKRIGIDILTGWKKGDVVSAINEYYEQHPQIVED